jgi:hypothetical protein
MPIPPFPSQFELTVRNAKIEEQLHVLQSANVHGALNVAGAAHLEQNLQLDGSLTIAGAVEVTGHILTNSTLAVTTDANIGGALTVGGPSRLSGDTEVQGALRVARGMHRLSARNGPRFPTASTLAAATSGSARTARQLGSIFTPPIMMPSRSQIQHWQKAQGWV